MAALENLVPRFTERLIAPTVLVEGAPAGAVGDRGERGGDVAALVAQCLQKSGHPRTKRKGGAKLDDVGAARAQDVRICISHDDS